MQPYVATQAQPWFREAEALIQEHAQATTMAAVLARGDEPSAMDRQRLCVQLRASIADGSQAEWISNLSADLERIEHRSTDP